MIRTSFTCPLDYTHLFLNHFMYFMGHFVLSVDYFVNMTILPLSTIRIKSPIDDDITIFISRFSMFSGTMSVK